MNVRCNQSSKEHWFVQLKYIPQHLLWKVDQKMHLQYHRYRVEACEAFKVSLHQPCKLSSICFSHFKCCRQTADVPQEEESVPVVIVFSNKLPNNKWQQSYQCHHLWCWVGAREWNKIKAVQLLLPFLITYSISFKYTVPDTWLSDNYEKWSCQYDLAQSGWVWYQTLSSQSSALKRLDSAVVEWGSPCCWLCFEVAISIGTAQLLQTGYA